MSAKPSRKVLEIQERLREQQLRRLGALTRERSHAGPTKKKAKGSAQKLQDTFLKNLRGVPNGGIMGMIAAKRTGTRVVEQAPGLLRSARNSNTTQGSYNRTVVTEPHEVVGQRIISDAQGRI